MKTSQYYRLDEKVGGMKGGASLGKAMGKRAREVKSIFSKVKHGIASPFKKTFQKSGVGMNPKELLEKPKGPINKLKRFFTTKSARYRQAANAATGITNKSRKRIAKIFKNTTASNSLSNSKREKRATQIKKIIEKINPSVKTSVMTYNQLKNTLETEYAGKKEAYRQTFASLNKTKTKLNTLKKNTQALTNAGTKLDTARTTLQGLKKTNANYKQTKKQYNEAFSEKTKAEKAFKKSKKIWNAHDKKKGSIKRLINYSKNQTMGKRAGRTLKKAAKVGAVLAATVAAPIPTLAVMGAYGAQKGSKKIRNQAKSKKSFIQNYTNAKNNVKKQEKIAKRIRKKYDSPENREAILRTISEGKKLTEAKNLQLDLNLPYADFKTSIEAINTLTYEEKETLKDYHKATEITRIRNSSNKSMSKRLNSATETITELSPEKAPQSTLSAEQVKIAADKEAVAKTNNTAYAETRAKNAAALKKRKENKQTYNNLVKTLKENNSNFTKTDLNILKKLKTTYNFSSNNNNLNRLIANKENTLSPYVEILN